MGAGSDRPVVEDIGSLNDSGDLLPVGRPQQQAPSGTDRRGTIAAGAGIVAFGYILLYTALTSSPPVPVVPEPEVIQSVPPSVKCEELTFFVADNQHYENVEVEPPLGACTVAARPPAGAAINPVSACDAVGGHVTAWREGEYPTLLEQRPALPSGQRILTTTDAESQTVMELGIVMPNQTFALCGPVEWRYEHDGQQLTQQIPADADLGELPEGRYYAYERTTEGSLELRGVGNRHYYVEPLPEGFDVPGSLRNEP